MKNFLKTILLVALFLPLYASACFSTGDTCAHGTDCCTGYCDSVYYVCGSNVICTNIGELGACLGNHCFWNAELTSCSNIPEACAMLTNIFDCINAGCNWDGLNCYTPAAAGESICITYSNQTDCENSAGCSWGQAPYSGCHATLPVIPAATNYSFGFTDFGTWYSANASGGYASPTAFATQIVSFIQPIFIFSGNFFGNNLQYFNGTGSYSSGLTLGALIPATQRNLETINIFFGGFPLINFLELIFFVMLCIFVVRTIFKFIPFFG